MVEDLNKLYPNSFDRLGSLKGEYNIRVDPTVKPAAHARRKVPIESKEAIDRELDYLIEEEIITEQVEPTPWVSSVTFPMKPNREVRVCLDPSNLNKAIIREHHKPMTVEEIAHELARATVYTKADALKAFLQIHLTHEASLLTTFNSHRGRLHFLRMPFRAKMSQDVFQMWMDAILKQCPGVIGIHDDMVIYGVDQEALIAKANKTPLRYYDRMKPVKVQADASLSGLGACLIQEHQGEDQPIAFASKSLMDSETRYANIERELLAIVFACQWFSTYLLGRSFITETDHKPLEMIAMKNLANAPPRLQRMLLELQRYDVTIKYRPGPQMQLADALSRCPARASLEIKLDMRVDYIAFMKPWIEKLKDSIQRDPILGTVYQLTQQGWPHQQRHVPRLARRYWDFRD